MVHSIGPMPIHAVQAAPDGTLWLGSDSMGVGHFDPKTERVRWFTAPDGLVGRSFWAVLIDRTGAIWAGSDRGLFRADPGSTKFQHVDEAGVTDATLARCFALVEAPNGDIWVGSASGVWRYSQGSASPSNGKWSHFTTEDVLTHQTVIALAAGANGDLWLGYRLTGTITRLRFSNGKAQFEHFDPPAGQPMNITYFLGFDARGQLWAGTNLGILNRDATGHWNQYDHHDGLIWDDCDLHGFAAEPDGHIWIGTSGGLSHFLPRAAPAPSEPPRTIFTSVVSGRTELDPAHSFTLGYSSEALVTRFTALRFGRERDILFRYRLEPLFTTWRETPDRELQFPAMPPGKYRLEVEARDTLSGWSDVPASFEFRVKAPWWREWWFMGASIMSAASLAGYLLRRRNERQEAIRRALENAVAERTRELSHQYRHDVLTGLPNRLLFAERLHRELLNARKDNVRVAVLFIDLDRFKRINDTWGHQTGDLFLQQIADRLRSGLRSGETIGRIGGDEFIVLIPGLVERFEAETRGWDLLRTLEAPIRIEGKNVFATMSVGIATFPDDALEPGALMAAADAAMYHAKAAGKNQVQPFEPGMTEAASRPQNIEDRLREALKNGGFRLRYQPQYMLDGKLEGFEALLRIQGMERDLGPAEFIPIAEESGLIVEIGSWVLREACGQMRAWRESGFPDVRVAVNVSVVQLAHAGFEAYLLRVIAETGIDPSHLELELTETALVKDTGDSASLLNRIRQRGIQVALDDFGTGFSPMQYLHQLPVDVVKIDQVFIKDLDAIPSSVPLVEGMVKLAKTLNLRVVAEGVESQAQLAILREIGFDVAQGNLLSLPVTPLEAEELLRVGELARV
jgi:diguanylate cyclase (GGDEF)-like protein